jgi:hypothetical protein
MQETELEGWARSLRRTCARWWRAGRTWVEVSLAYLDICVLDFERKSILNAFDIASEEIVREQLHCTIQKRAGRLDMSMPPQPLLTPVAHEGAPMQRVVCTAQECVYLCAGLCMYARDAAASSDQQVQDKSL